MREILFRGKQEHDGRWIFGNLMYNKSEYYEDALIFQAGQDGTAFVVPETVGQYTGIDDGNGKKIFEDDVVRWTDDDGETHDLVVAFRNGAFVCLHPELDIEPEPETLYECLALGLTVVGNIHDGMEDDK